MSQERSETSLEHFGMSPEDSEMPQSLPWSLRTGPEPFKCLRRTA